MSDSPEKTMPPAIVYPEQISEWSARAGRQESDAVSYVAHHVRRALKQRAEIIVGPHSVTVPRISPNGPDVTATIADGRYTLAIGGWFDDLHSLDAVITYMTLVANGQLRVRVDKLGDKPWQFALEQQLDNGVWQEEGVVVLPRFSLWPLRRTTYYLQNDLES